MATNPTLTPMTTSVLDACACLDLPVDVGETFSGNGELVTDSDDVDKIVVVTSKQDVLMDHNQEYYETDEPGHNDYLEWFYHSQTTSYSGSY